MRILIVLASLVALIWPVSQLSAAEKSEGIMLDEDVWVLFYDVPSRRLRRARDAFVRRDWGTVAGDLAVAAGFVRAEASRSIDDLVFPLENIADRLDSIGDGIESPDIVGSDLDAAFARAHWLLAQHYLELAVSSRDALDSKNAGAYLWATVHHMERTVLWSDARLTRPQLNSLETLGDLAGRLRNAKDSAEIFKEQPIKLARKTLFDLGEHMDRKIWLVQ